MNAKQSNFFCSEEEISLSVLWTFKQRMHTQKKKEKKVAPKIIPPILWCWLMLSEMDVQREGSRDWILSLISCYIYIFLPCYRSKWVVVWQNSTWHESDINQNHIIELLQAEKLQRLTFIDTCWMFTEAKMWISAQLDSG